MSTIAKRADQLQEAQEIAESVRDLQDELVPVLITVWAGEHREEEKGVSHGMENR